MIDLSSSEIRAKIVEDSASPIKNSDGKVISKGKHTSRINLIDGSDVYSIAVHSPFSSKPLNLNLIERLYMVVLKVKDEHGDIEYVKVNANSLKKRLGISAAEFKAMNKSGTSDLILNKIHAIFEGKKTSSAPSKQPDDENKSLREGSFEEDTAAKINGYGTSTYPDGSKYKGEFKDGVFHGHGTLFYVPDGSKYEGEFDDGVFHGHGTLLFVSGDTYVGEFKDGMKNGYGTYIYADGDKFEGEFIDGIANGRGIYTNANGSKFEGEYKNGIANGRGTRTDPDGSKYQGEFKDGIPNGYGINIFADGSKYEGEYKDGLPNGYGTRTYLDGSKYEGEYKDGIRNGPGTYTFRNGSKEAREYKDGKLII